ncbi:MAG: TIGR00266 family protein [Bradymonadaceae bacterium]
MDIEILYRPVNTLARVRLEEGESVQAEPGAMVGMSGGVDMQTGMDTSGGGSSGGLLGQVADAAKQALGGESFFKNTFTAHGGTGEVLLSQKLSGDIVSMTIPERGLKLQSSAYIANSEGGDVDAEMGGSSGWLGGEGLFRLGVEARGPDERIIFGAFGGIEEVEVDGSMVVDSGHMVAWEPSVELTTEQAGGGLVASMLSGEGRVFRLQGNGRAWFQTRHPDEFGQRIGPKLPPKQQQGAEVEIG